MFAKLNSIFQHSRHPTLQKNNIHPQECQHANCTNHNILHTSGETVYLINHYNPFRVLENADTFQGGISRAGVTLGLPIYGENWGKLVSGDDYLLAGISERTSLVKGQLWTASVGMFFFFNCV